MSMFDKTSLNDELSRDGWPAGPWDDEPDKAQWTAHGFDCLIVRNRFGALCGYVGLPPDHPLHGFSYNAPVEGLRGVREELSEPVGECPPFIAMLCAGIREDDGEAPSPDASFAVHGGLTFSDKCTGNICHAPRDGGPDDIWWLGFDCNHAGDMAPGRRRMFPEETYRTIDYVKAETERLARQLATLTPTPGAES